MSHADGQEQAIIKAIRARTVTTTPASAPKYQVVHDAIVDAISTGELSPGIRLPTETTLAGILPYSLGTIQKAFGQLVKEGLVTRRRGIGSFVAPSDKQMVAPWHCRFLGDDGTVLPVFPRVLGHQPAPHDTRLAQIFKADVKLVRIDRAISINHEFQVISHFFTPEAIAKSLLSLPPKKVETANFKAILLRELGMPIARIVQMIGSADRRIWRKLSIPFAAHLVLEVIAYTKEGWVAYFQVIYIPRNGRKLLFDSSLSTGA